MYVLPDQEIPLLPGLTHQAVLHFEVSMEVPLNSSSKVRAWVAPGSQLGSRRSVTFGLGRSVTFGLGRSVTLSTWRGRLTHVLFIRYAPYSAYVPAGNDLAAGVRVNPDGHIRGLFRSPPQPTLSPLESLAIMTSACTVMHAEERTLRVGVTFSPAEETDGELVSETCVIVALACAGEDVAESPGIICRRSCSSRVAE